MKSKPLIQVNNIPLILILGALISLAALSFPAFAADDTPEAKSTVSKEDKADSEEDSEKAADDDDGTSEDGAEDDDKQEGHQFTYPGCDFELTLPSEPYKTRRCEAGKTNCYDLTTYTQVYDMMTTIDISVSCKGSRPEKFAHYNESVMRTAMKGMVGRNTLDDAQIGFRDMKDYKVANLSGAGQNGRQNQIYVAQLWVAPHSILTVEAQLIGNAHPEADKTFSNILRSITYKEANHPEKTPRSEAGGLSGNN